MTSFNPQTNGLTERLSKTLADMLSMYVDVEPKDAVYMTFAYNTAVHETMQTAPFELMYGREPPTMLDTMSPHVEDDDVNTDVRQFLQCTEETRQLARIRTKDQQAGVTRRYKTRRQL